MTWTLLTDPNAVASNPIAGLSVSSIVVDQNNPGQIYIATGNASVSNLPPPTAASPEIPGVFSYNGGTQTFFNLTGTPSIARGSVLGPGTPGPDDNFNENFPQTSTAWRELQLVYADPTDPPAVFAPNPIPILYASLGDPLWSNVTSEPESGYSNAIYRTYNPQDDSASSPAAWYVGDPGLFADQQETITITFAHSTGQFNLAWPAATNITSTITAAQYMSVAGVNKIVNGGAGFTGLAQLFQVSPAGSPGFGPVPASSSISLVPGSVVITAASCTFTIQFGGIYSYQSEPLVIAPANDMAFFSGGDTVTTVITQNAGGINTQSALEFPAGPFPHNALDLPYPINGNIQFTAVAYGPTTGPRNLTASHMGLQISNAFPVGPDNPAAQVVLYAAVARPDWYLQPPYPNYYEQSFAYYFSDDGGFSWVAMPSAPPPSLMGGTPATGNGEGGYSLAVAQDDTNYQIAVMASVGDSMSTSGPAQPQGPASGPYMTVDAGKDWIDIGTDINGNSPQVDAHSVAFDNSNKNGSSGNHLIQGNLLMGTDGGTWKFNDVLSFIMTNDGAGYFPTPGNPIVVTLGGGGAVTPATATAVTDGLGHVIGITITGLGSGFDPAAILGGSPITISIAGAGGAGATAVVDPNYLTWVDLNGTVPGSGLSITSFNQVASNPGGSNGNPSSPYAYLAASTAQGIVRITGNSPTATLESTAQITADTSGPGGTIAPALPVSQWGSAYQVAYDPQNSQIAYAVTYPLNPGRNSSFGFAGTGPTDPYTLRKSTDGGQTWSKALLNTDPVFLSPALGITAFGNPSPMVLAVDPFNQQRLVVGDNLKLKESVNGGASWITLAAFPADDKRLCHHRGRPGGLSRNVPGGPQLPQHQRHRRQLQRQPDDLRRRPAGRPVRDQGRHQLRQPRRRHRAVGNFLD